MNEGTQKSAISVVKIEIILLILAAVFVRTFLVTVEMKVAGPISTEEVDELHIQEAHWDASNDALFLVATGRWARLDLKQRPGNIFIRWSDFVVGRPSVVQLTNTEPVSVMTEQDQITSIPEGFSAALFRGQPVSLDNHMWFNSYTLLTTQLRADGHHYVNFLYNPWVKTTSFHAPGVAFFIYGPSYIALCIALPLAFSKVRLSISTILFIAAFLLHGISSIFILLLVRVGEAFSGYGENHDFPLSFMMSGWVILVVLAWIRFAKKISAI